MIASSAGRNRSFWRSSRGLATASPNADDPPPNRTNRPKRESQIARNQRLAAVFPRNRLLLSPRFAKRLNAHAILHGRLLSSRRDLVRMSANHVRRDKAALFPVGARPT